MTQAAAGGWVRQAAAIVIAVLVGAGMLTLFLLALAWAPIDRRWGRRGHRQIIRHSAATRPVTADASGAYGIGSSVTAVSGADA